MATSASANADRVEIRPQAGPQAAAAASGADVLCFGGKAGGGKTFQNLLECVRHIGNPGFRAVIFRRTYPEIKNPGALWDTSFELFPHCGGKPRESVLEWVFPSGATVKFAHMQHEDDRLQWDGAQIPLICFDQVEHFTRRQFFYMLARNRSMCGVIPYIRTTANPVNAENRTGGWLRSFISYWINEQTGIAIPKRSGVLRWFWMVQDSVDWADSAEELIRRHGPDTMPKSFTFIPASVFDNKILLEQNPQYLANLKALPLIDRLRLDEGNWNVRETAGMFFKARWFEIVDAAPVLVDEIRYWDRAGTEEKDATSQHSYTAGVKMGKCAQGVYYVTHVEQFRGSALKVEKTIKNKASQDGQSVRIGIEGDPGQAGKSEAEKQVRNLAGYDARINTVRESKGTRAKLPSAQAEAGNIKLVRGTWNQAYLQELENFDGSKECLSDQTDATSGAFHMLTNAKRAGVWGV